MVFFGSDILRGDMKAKLLFSMLILVQGASFASGVKVLLKNNAELFFRSAADPGVCLVQLVYNPERAPGRSVDDSLACAGDVVLREFWTTAGACGTWGGLGDMGGEYSVDVSGCLSVRVFDADHCAVGDRFFEFDVDVDGTLDEYVSMLPRTIYKAGDVIVGGDFVEGNAVIEAKGAPPVVKLSAFYESLSGGCVEVDATPVGGVPANFVYQWYFDGGALVGATNEICSIDGRESNNGIWSVLVSNGVGSTNVSFVYAVFFDGDSDGLSDGSEVYLHFTDPATADSDSDGLGDGDEVLVYETDPSALDSDKDGYRDGYEVVAGSDPAIKDGTPAFRVQIDTVSSAEDFVSIGFGAISGGVFSVEATDNLLSEWRSVESGVIGSGERVVVPFLCSGVSNCYFRVMQNMP